MAEKTFIGRKECSELLGVSIATLDNYTKQGFLQAYSLNRRIMFSREDVINKILNSKI